MSCFEGLLGVLYGLRAQVSDRDVRSHAELARMEARLLGAIAAVRATIAEVVEESFEASQVPQPEDGQE